MNPLTIPLAAGGELRLVLDGDRCDLQCWHRYPDGRALMQGGLRLGPQDLRLALHALRTAVWAVERVEGGFRVPSWTSDPRAA